MEMPAWKQQEDDRNLLVDFRRSFIRLSRAKLSLPNGMIVQWSSLPDDLETARLWARHNKPVQDSNNGRLVYHSEFNNRKSDNAHKSLYCPAHEQRWKASTPPTLDLKIAIANCEDCKAVRMGLPVELLSKKVATSN